MGYTSDIEVGELTRRKQYTAQDVLNAYIELQKEAAEVDGKDAAVNPTHWKNQVYQEFIDTDGEAYIEDTDAKWYAEWTDPMIKWYSKYFYGHITFEGEDGAKWRYVLPEDKPNEVIYQSAERYYGNLIDHFIEVYNDSIPDSLRKELDKFKVILNI